MEHHDGNSNPPQDAPRLPACKQIELPLGDDPNTLTERFQKFHTKNPHVYNTLVELAGRLPDPSTAGWSA